MGRDKAKGMYWKFNNRCITCGRPAKQREDGTYYSVCEMCYARAKYANERKAKGHKDFGKKQTLRWDCRHALPDASKGTGCSWSRTLTPVEGWKAVPTKQVVNECKEVTSYCVEKCPLFEKYPEREVKK